MDPGSACNGGNPPGPGTTMRSGAKSTVAVKCKIPSSSKNPNWTAAVLRYLIISKNYNVGLLSGLGDSKLSRVLIAIHEKPEHNWTLDRLASIAGMSRAKFAAHFRLTINVLTIKIVKPAHCLIACKSQKL
jgi:hypothetical protein